MIKVKVCGITNLEDALYAAHCGADALGFVFYKRSPRYISRDRVRKIIEFSPPFITTVGLFVNEDSYEIRKTVRYCHLDAIQLHGDEPPEFCASLKDYKIIKALRVIDQESIKKVDNYRVSAILLDVYTKDSYGGTGQSFNWNLAAKIETKTKIILAGGLSPQNVSEAIKIVKPYGVDVSSGVERKPGKKDLKKVKEFIRMAKLSEPIA